MRVTFGTTFSEMRDYFKLDTSWKSNARELYQHTFTILTETAEQCQQMERDLKSSPEAYFSLLQADVAIDARKEVADTITVQEAHIKTAKMMSQLRNMSAAAAGTIRSVVHVTEFGLVT